MPTSQAVLSLGRQLGHRLTAHSLRPGVPHQHSAGRIQQRIRAIADLLVVAGRVRLPARAHLQPPQDCQCCSFQSCGKGTSQHSLAHAMMALVELCHV